MIIPTCSLKLLQLWDIYTHRFGAKTLTNNNNEYYFQLKLHDEEKEKLELKKQLDLLTSQFQKLISDISVKTKSLKDAARLYTLEDSPSSKLIADVDLSSHLRDLSSSFSSSLLPLSSSSPQSAEISTSPHLLTPTSCIIDDYDPSPHPSIPLSGRTSSPPPVYMNCNNNNNNNNNDHINIIGINNENDKMNDVSEEEKVGEGPSLVEGDAASPSSGILKQLMDLLLPYYYN